MDLREKLVDDICRGLTAVFDANDIDVIKSILLINVDKYELQERCTDLAVIETTSEKLINLYAGTLLTEGKSKKTVYQYTREIRMFYEAVNKPLTEVNVFDVRVYLAKAQQNVLSITVENKRSCLASFYRWLTDEEIIGKNPMNRIKPVKFDEGIKKAFTDIEVDALRCSCKSIRTRAELEVMLSSGVRVSELCSLNRSDIDFKTLEVTVRHGKGNKSRKTYISPVCAVHLEEYLKTRTDTDPCLFRSRLGTRVTPKTIERGLKVLGAKAGIDDIYPHKFRRTFATTMARKGMDVSTIQQLMGHSDVNTTMGYIAISGEHVLNEYRKYN